MMRQFITGKKIIFVIFLILITIFMMNLNSKWDSEPIYSNRLKVASIFSADSDFELYRYKFSVENGYNKGHQRKADSINFAILPENAMRSRLCRICGSKSAELLRRREVRRLLFQASA